MDISIIDQRKRRSLAGLCIVIVTVIVVIAIFGLRCEPKTSILSEQEPMFDIKDLTDVASQDGAVLVAFQGYAEYLLSNYGNRVYLALAPVTGINVNTVQDQAPIEMTLRSEHGILSISFRKEGYTTHIQRISLATDDGDAEKSCEIEDAKISFLNESHFDCERPKTFECSRYGKDKNGNKKEIKVAYLTISAIRAEIEGRAVHHNSKNYTYPTDE